MFFIFVGHFKVTPNFFPDIHEDMRREFGRVNKVFPFYEITGWRPFARNYRLAVGITEIVCGLILVLVPGRLKQLANVILLITMLGAVYTHYTLGDKFERMAPGLAFSLLLLTRLIIHRQVTQREKGLSTEKKPAKSESEEEKMSNKNRMIKKVKVKMKMKINQKHQVIRKINNIYNINCILYVCRVCSLCSFFFLYYIQEQKKSFCDLLIVLLI